MISIPADLGRATVAAMVIVERSTSEEEKDRTQPEAPADAESEAEAKERRGPIQRLLALRTRAQEPAASRCVIMGPSASGKTLLLMSLGRCEGARSHSYAHNYTVTIGGRNQDFRTIQDLLPRYFPAGLTLDASKLEDCFLPELTLHVTEKRGLRRRQDTRFRTFDGAGGLLVEGDYANDPGYRKCRARLEGALADCDKVLLCLPIVKRIAPQQEAALQDFIHDFIRHRRIRELVVCFTMYEKLGIDMGRDAFRRLATRRMAREQMARALNDQLRPLDNALRQFDGRWGRRVWCAPVSTYGFIPQHGGVNLARFGDDELLRSLPEGNPHGIPSPYSHDQAFHYWRPFLTLDPFVFIATGNRDGTLIHAYSELHG